MDRNARLKVQDYSVGWISALPVELAAAQVMLDEEHSLPEDFPLDDGDDHLYTFGRIGTHNVVLSCLPAGVIGNNAAAAVALKLITRFRNIRIGLLVGIGGGVPSPDADIRLGDIVVSTPTGSFGGVVQYDLGKSLSHGFQRTGSLNSPPRLLLSALSILRARHYRGVDRMSEHLSVFDMLPTFSRENTGPDILYEGGSPKVRSPRNSSNPSIHYGTIASGNTVIKDSDFRDRVSRDLNGVLCFEMEAAGLMDDFPCLVIRGICDYADAHKNNKWQPRAAAAAAAVAKELMSVIPPSTPTSSDVVAAHAELGESLDNPPEIVLEWSPPTHIGMTRVPGVADNTVEEAGETIELPGGPRRGRPRKIKGDVKESDKENSPREKEKQPIYNRQPDDTIFTHPFQQPAPKKSLFTLFDRTTHIHFYREVYHGNGTLIRNVINNQRGNISSSGGSVNFGNVTGSMHSNNGQQMRHYGTRAYRGLRHPLDNRPHLNWSSWGGLRHVGRSSFWEARLNKMRLTSWIKKW